MHKFKPGDVIVANEKANRFYTITSKGWIGTVVKVDETDHVHAVAKNSTSSRVYDGLLASCFDLYEGADVGECISIW